MRLFNNHGFSLIELSIVLIVVALLASGLMLNFAAQQDNAANLEALQRLDEAREALLGFAITRNRLPCPASPGKSGIESPEGGGDCSNPWDGYLPAVTLGIQPVNAQGYAIDPWGNPIRYAISTFKSPECGTGHCLATGYGLRNAWNSNVAPAPDLRVCNTANNSTGSSGSAECASDTALTKDAAAIIFSLGKNGGQIPTDKDEIANQNGDRLFVASTFSSSPRQFDDQLLWLSSNVLYSRLFTAGRLP